MNITNGKVIISIGAIHTILTIAPFVYGTQFANFSSHAFFAVNDGFFETGGLDYETFAAYWCFCFGIFLFPLGILVNSLEKNGTEIPRNFTWSYLIAIAIGAYMIPWSGFTVFLLPHAIYMLLRTNKRT